MCLSPSTGQIGDGHDALGPNPDQKFARDAIATTVLLGPFASHIAPTQYGRPSSYFFAVVAQGGDAVNGDKGERRAFVVDADGYPGISPQAFPLEGVFPGVEDDVADRGVGPSGSSVECEPDGCNMGASIGPHRSHLGGVGGLRLEKRPHVVIAHRVAGQGGLPLVGSATPAGSTGARVCGGPTTPPVQRRAWPRSAC